MDKHCLKASKAPRTSLYDSIDSSGEDGHSAGFHTKKGEVGVFADKLFQA